MHLKPCGVKSIKKRQIYDLQFFHALTFLSGSFADTCQPLFPVPTNAGTFVDLQKLVSATPPNNG
jgi:hypothetical protein